MLRRRVCGASDVPVGELRGFAVEGLARPVLVANVGGRLYAAASTCPHEDVSLLDGELDGARVICPGHGYAFDLASGRCTHDAALVLPRHRIAVEGDDVFVELLP